MAWRTIKIEVGSEVLTATEPSCAIYEALLSAKEEAATYTESAEFVRSCLAVRHPEVTLEQVKKGMTPQGLGRAVKALMDLSGAEEPKPGEPASA